MIITIKNCSEYLTHLNLKDVCGIRKNLHETFISRVAKHTNGVSNGYAYTGGNLLNTPQGYTHLSPQIAQIAESFDDCPFNDFAAYDVDENGLTYGAYISLPCGRWFKEYKKKDTLKAYSPEVYRRYYKK